MMAQSVPARVSDLFFMAATMTIMIGMKTLLDAVEADERTPFLFRIENTQRKRYFFLWVGTAISFSVPAYIVVRYGFWTFWRASGEYLSLPTYFGTILGIIVCIGTWFGLISPIIGFWASWHIYRHPCLLAKRVPGGWVMTKDLRDKSTPSMVVEPHVFDDRKEYIPTGRIST